MTGAVRVHGPSLDEILAARLGLSTATRAGRMAERAAKWVFGYRHARALLDALEGLHGAEALDAMQDAAKIAVAVSGQDVIPQSGAALLVTNHPTGAPDGIALWAAIKHRRRDVSFVSSSEALSFLKSADELIIPVDLSGFHRQADATRRLGHALLRAVKQKRLIVLTPAGQIAQRPDGEEEAWDPGYALLAARLGLPVIAAHISARNSRAYYLAGRVHRKLQQLLVFRQLINRRGVPLHVRFDHQVHRIDHPRSIEAFNEMLRGRVFRLASMHRD